MGQITGTSGMLHNQRGNFNGRSDTTVRRCPRVNSLFVVWFDELLIFRSRWNLDDFIYQKKGVSSWPLLTSATDGRLGGDEEPWT